MRIICLCSGEGRRMLPLSLVYPKSLIPINMYLHARTIIENTCLEILDNVKEVDEIVFVASRAYFERQDYLNMEGRLSENCKVIRVVNASDPAKYNNWYSVCKVFEEEGCSTDSIIVEGDVIAQQGFGRILRESLEKHPDNSMCFCTYRENEWVVTRDPYGNNHIMKNASGLALSGISRVLPEDAKKYMNQIFSSKQFWDEAFIKVSKSLIMIDAKDTLKDFDTIKELIAGEYLDQDTLVRRLSDDGTYEMMESMTNQNYLINHKGQKCIVRTPGYRTEEFIDRSRESKVYQLVSDQLDITPRTEIYDDGLKITEYIEGCRTSDPRDMVRVMETLAMLHDGCSYEYKDPSILIDLVKEVESYITIYAGLDDEDLPVNYTKVSEFYLKMILENQHQDLVLCHRDLDPRNILIKDDKTYLVDFEYSGYLNRYWDLGCYISEIELFNETYSSQDFLKSLEVYSRKCGLEVDRDKLDLWSGIVDFVWSCWSIAKCALGAPYWEYLDERWSRACRIYEKYCQSMT